MQCLNILFFRLTSRYERDSLRLLKGIVLGKMNERVELRNTFIAISCTGLDVCVAAYKAKRDILN